jgi:LuxR family maltose regulon positive regulatory protein
MGPGDLAFDAAEAWLLLRWAGVDAGPEDVEVLVRRTGGWAAGLYLTALALRAGSGEPAASRLLAGTGRFVVDDLRAEVMDRLADDERRFLRRTAFLDELSGSLCDQVTAEPGSTERLRALEEANRFLFPLDGQREWYRCHGVFRELLQAELLEHEPQLLPYLHRRAADWYTEHGRDDVALEHVRAGGDVGRAAALTARAALPAFARGRHATASRWLDALPPDDIAHLPTVAVQAAWGYALSGRAAEASRWAQLAERGTFDGPPPDGSASIESSRAMLRAAMLPAGVEAALSDAELAVEQEPPSSPWSACALTGLFLAQQLSGASAAAAATLERLVEATQDPPGAGLAHALTERSRLAIARGDWTAATGDLDRAQRAIDDLGLHEHLRSGLTHAVRARATLQAGDPERAVVDHLHGLRLRGLATWALPALAVEVRLELASFSVAAADHGAARTLLDEIERIVARRPGLGALLAEVDALRAQLSGARTGAVGPSSLTTAELRLVPYLHTHLTPREIGSRLFLSPDTIDTQLESIYRKLAVTARSDAVDRARDLGLLAGPSIVGS